MLLSLFKEDRVGGGQHLANEQERRLGFRIQSGQCRNLFLDKETNHCYRDDDENRIDRINKDASMASLHIQDGIFVTVSSCCVDVLHDIQR